MTGIAERIADEYKISSKTDAVIVCGPTASGKSDAAMELCSIIGGEIVSCDSMQIYRLMDIGTAKATPEMRQKIPHHMIDIADPWGNYSLYMYKKAALAVIEDIISRGKVPVICGGTGLYVNTLIDNRQLTDLPDDSFFSEESRLEKEKCDCLLKENDIDGLHLILEKNDPEAASQIHKNNVKRVYRSLCLYFMTGKTMAERNDESLKSGSEYSFLTYCLMPDRGSLYRRIDARVDIMREAGLFNEAERVYSACRDNLPSDAAASLEILKLTALNAIGYKELIPLFDFPELKPLKIYNPDEAFDMIKRDSRQYAKRQITWFKRTPGASFIEI